MEKQLLKTYGSGCARNIAFQIVSVVLTFGIFIIPALIAALWGGDTDTNFAIFMGILLFILLADIAGAVIWGLNSIRKRAAYLDDVFSLWEMEGAAYLQSGRQYHGEINRRQVEIYFHRGPTLEIQIAAPLHTRAAVVFKSEIGKLPASLGDYENVPLNDPLFHNLSIYALDANWMKNLLNDNSPMRQAILQLMRVAVAYEMRQILILPEALKINIRRVSMDQLNRENMNIWMDALHAVLHAIEAAPRPQEITIAIPVEAANPSKRKSLAWLSAGIGCNILLALAVCAGLVAFIVVIASRVKP